MFGFLVAVMFWPGQAGAAEASRWALLCVAVPTALFFVRPKLNVIHWVGMLFLAWAIISLAWTPVRYDGLNELMQLMIFAGMFLVGQSDLGKLYQGLGLGLCVSSVICIAQALGFHLVTSAAADASTGLFVNQNILAEITAAVFVALLCQRSWWLAAGLLPAIILSQCRSAILALAICAAYAAWRKWRWWSVAALPPVMIVAGLLTVAKSLRADSWHYRLDMWRDAIDGLTVWGHGIGSFYSVYPAFETRMDSLYQPAHVHNDLLEFVFELGVPGLILICLLVGLIVWKAQHRERMVMLAIGVTAMFGFPLHSPATVFLFGAVAGCSARGWDYFSLMQFCRGLSIYSRGERSDLAAARVRIMAISAQSRIQVGTAQINHSR